MPIFMQRQSLCLSESGEEFTPVRKRSKDFKMESGFSSLSWVGEINPFGLLERVAMGLVDK